MTEETWTPYGLERYRAQGLRKRRVFAIGAVLVLALAWALFTERTIESSTDVLAGGGGNTVGIVSPQQREQTGPDAVVSVRPGGITQATAGEPQAQEGTGSTPVGPPQFAATPVNWPLLLLRYLPFALLGFVLWAGFRARPGKSDEVNFGIYKGAMPLEMITASHAHVVVTSKEARASLFGRSREHYVPPRDPLVR